MATYSTTKSISKFLIYFSLFAVLVSGGSFLVSKSKIGADTTTPAKDYEVMVSGSTVVGIIANNISSSDITSYNYNNNPTSDLIKMSSNCDLGEGCYQISNTNNWNDPSIALDNGKFKPAWAFLTEVKAKAEAVGDTNAVNQIKSVSANYVAASFSRNMKSKLNFTATDGYITIDYSEFFEALENAGIKEEDPHMSFFKESNSNKVASMNFSSFYPEAKENSAWLAAAEFVVGSMLKPYKDAGFDTSQYEQAINLAQRNYYLGITKEDKGKALSLSYPLKLILSQKSERVFEYNIDIKAFPIPKDGYKTKIYIKPASKKDADAHIIFGPFGESSYQFSFSEAVSSDYVDSNGQKVNLSGADYDTNFPQQYIMRAVTYDGDTEKDNILATFETHNDSTLTDDAVSDGNSILKISAKPSAVKQGGEVTATIEAINSSETNKQIKKVILYACTGTAADVAKNDSSSCTINVNGTTEDAIKTVFEGDTLQFKDEKTTLTGSWDTSGSAIGNHALIAKAFSANQGGYIDGSKTAVTVAVTNSSTGSISGSQSGKFSNLLASKFSKRASENPRGSSIKNIGDLVKKISTWVLSFIGILAFFAIVIGGFQYMGAGGDQDKANKAKKTIIFAIAGVFLAALSYALIRIVVSILNSIIT